MPTSHLIVPRGRRRTTRWSRALRAMWRDTSALWSEFKVPVLIFLAVVFGGGGLYGLLWARAGYAPIPYIDLPYIMAAFMVLQPHADPVPNPELMAFWYFMPLFAILIFSRGAADFLRLFFDRSERKSAWEEAVASTYRNHVIVLGVGHVGLRVIRTLATMGFEVIGIDIKPKPDIDESLNRLDVPLIVADGRTADALEKAGIRYAQSFIVTTANDAVNMEAIMRARHMNKVVRIVARVWDEQLRDQLTEFFGVEAVFSASDLAAPAFAGAAVGVEITQTLHVQGVEYSMIRMRVESGSMMENRTIGQLQNENKIDIVLHSSDGNVEVQPSHDLVVHGGDTLVLFAHHAQVMDLAAHNQRARKSGD